jgi:hypothetical protein
LYEPLLRVRNAVVGKASELAEGMRGGAGGSGPGDAVADRTSAVEVPDLAAGEYLVTEILEHRVSKGGRTRYYVAWVGYGEQDQELWIEESQLRDDDAALRLEYSRKLEQKGASATRAGRIRRPPRHLADFVSEPDI